jgi:bacterioferritin
MDKKKDPHTYNRRCALPEPYPEPEVIAPNLYYAQLLLEDYTGAVSELTAINQYIYHYFTFNHFKDLAELEECISIIEMKHLELLAETIRLLGMAPEFRVLTSNLPVYWSAAYVYYGIEISDKLDADIAAEIQAINNYRFHQQLINDPCIKQLLERIIMDEEHHLKLFREAKARYCHSH